MLNIPWPRIIQSRVVRKWRQRLDCRTRWIPSKHASCNTKTYIFRTGIYLLKPQPQHSLQRTLQQPPWTTSCKIVWRMWVAARFSATDTGCRHQLTISCWLEREMRYHRYHAWCYSDIKGRKDTRVSLYIKLHNFKIILSLHGHRMPWLYELKKDCENNFNRKWCTFFRWPYDSRGTL